MDNDDECVDEQTVIDDSVQDYEQSTAAPSTKKARLCVAQKQLGKNDMLENAYNIMTGLYQRHTEIDEHQIFANLVACKLRKLKTPHAQATVQHRIQTILYEGEQGMFDYPPPSRSNQFRNHCEYPPMHFPPPPSDTDGCNVTVHVPDDNLDEPHITQL